jgi:hypothetical protein
MILLLIAEKMRTVVELLRRSATIHQVLPDVKAELTGC